MEVFDVGYGEEEIKRLLSENRLGRNKNLQVMMNFLNKLERNMVLNLDDDWGTGKTVFLKQLEYLGNHTEQNENIPVINRNVINEFNDKYLVFYFNSWEHDLYDNPLESLLYSLLMKYSELNEEKVVEEKVRNNISSNLRTLGVIGGNLAIKKLSKGLIELGDLKTENPEDAHPTITSAESKRAAINSLISEIIGEKEQKILIIIDELDRCKPKYAINLLEVIKHFFDNNQVVFLFGTNKLELAESIRAEYGMNFNGYKYLNKFFDYHFTFPAISKEKYIDYLITHEIKEIRVLVDEINVVSSYFNFSLRDLNQYCSLFNNMWGYYKPNNDPFEKKNPIIRYLLLPYAIGLKQTSGEKFYEFIQGNGKKELENFYELSIEQHNYIIQWNQRITKNEFNELAELINTYEEVMSVRGTDRSSLSYEKRAFIDFLEILSMMSDRL